MASNQLKILFVGDTNFAESYQIRYVQKGGKNILEEMGYDYPFENLKTIILQSDLVVANLETPITNIFKSPIPVKTKKNFHWTDVEKAPRYFKKYNMKTFSLANNHMLDYGSEGLEQTLQILRENHMEWMGAGLDGTEASRLYVKEFLAGKHVFRLAIISGFEYRKLYDEDLDFYANKKVGGVNQISVENIAEQIRRLKESPIPNTFLVVFPHWGSNYTWKSDRQCRLGHKIIDVGANLIVGHGAHMMQEIEKYNGHWIVYGIGNFVYNPGGRYEKFNAPPFSLVVQLLVQENDGNLVKTMKVYPILTDNKITNFQARFLKEDEFEKAYKLLLEKSPQPTEFEKEIKRGKDDIGRFMEFLV